MIIVTTLLDAEKVSANDLAELYRARDLRSLKQTMQNYILRCKTPELVRKEIWTHILPFVPDVLASAGRVDGRWRMVTCLGKARASAG